MGEPDDKASEPAKAPRSAPLDPERLEAIERRELILEGRRLELQGARQVEADLAARKAGFARARVSEDGRSVVEVL